MVSWCLTRLEPLNLTQSGIASRGIVCECSVGGCRLVLDLDVKYQPLSHMTWASLFSSFNYPRSRY